MIESDFDTYLNGLPRVNALELGWKRAADGATRFAARNNGHEIPLVWAYEICMRTFAATDDTTELGKAICQQFVIMMTQIEHALLDSCPYCNGSQLG